MKITYLSFTNMDLVGKYKQNEGSDSLKAYRFSQEQNYNYLLSLFPKPISIFCSSFTSAIV